MRLRPVPRDSLTDAITRELTQMILRGDVASGGWLPPQPVIAQKLGVGLSTVREAVKGLTLLGVLSPQAGRGTRVSPDAIALLRRFDPVGTRLSELDAFKVCEARRAVEVELAGLAAERATTEDLARIRDALERMREAEDDLAYHKADVDYHRAVARSARNRLLEEFFQTTLELMAAVNKEVIALPGVKERALAIQQSVADAISRHDSQAARQRTYNHMCRLETLLHASLSLRSNAPPLEAGDLEWRSPVGMADV